MTATTDQLPIPEAVHVSVRDLLSEAMASVEIATGFTIANQDDASVAAEQLSGIAKLRKRADDERLSITRPYDDLKSRIIATYAEPGSKLGEAERLLRAELTRWTLAEQARVAEEQRIENARLEQERRKAQEIADREAERLAKLKTPEARAKAEARIEEAQERVTIAETTTAIVAPVAKTKGFGLRDNWQPSYEPDALATLVKAAAENPKMLIYLQLNTVQIGSVVKAMKAATDIPGVRAVNNKTSAVR